MRRAGTLFTDTVLWFTDTVLWFKPEGVKEHQSSYVTRTQSVQLQLIFTAFSGFGTSLSFESFQLT